MKKVIQVLDSNLEKSNDRLSFIIFALSGRIGDKIEFSTEEIRGCVDILSQISRDLRWLRGVVHQVQKRMDRAKNKDQHEVKVEEEIDRAMGIGEEFLNRENEDPFEDKEKDND